MTRPIYEPNIQRTATRLNYGQEQLFRRPPPPGGGSLAYCYMKWEGSEAVPANTFFNPATSPSPDVPYEESFIYDPDNTAGFTCDRDTGCIGWEFAGEYYVWASMTWNGTGSAGDTLGGMIEYGSSCSFATNRVFGTMRADVMNQNGQIPVERVIFAFADANDTVRVRVYHTDAGGNDIGIVWIHVVQLNVNTDGIFDP